MPTATEVAAYAGRGDDPEFVATAGKALPVVVQMVKAYVRGKGFTNGQPDEAVAAVITSATVRLATNPEGTISEGLGDYSIRPGVFAGWTLPELAILNAYRVRAR